MSAPVDVADLHRRAAAARAEYDAWFAGFPRITRDLTRLDRLRAIVAEVVAVLGPHTADPEAAAALEEARADLTLLDRERQAIAEAQAAGPEVIEAARIGTWVDLVAARYARHFAGQSRATRDLGLLGEMIADLNRLERELDDLGEEAASPDLQAARTALDQHRGLFVRERGEIVDARNAGEPTEQADRLAGLANEQFALYGAHFAGKSRVTRRPDLLQRIIDNLGQIRDRMDILRKAGHQNETHLQNIGIVDERIAFYRTELEQVRTARQQSKFDEMVGGLGASANEVFDEYRQHFAGQDRRTRELSRLGRMADALWDVARQMDDLDRVRENETNVHNLRVVLDRLAVYEREWTAIRQVQQQPAAK